MEEKAKILVVDDEEDLCEILQFNLEGEGFETHVVHSAEEVLKKNLDDYNLLLLDVMMGNMSGFKLAEKIRKVLKNNIPIIFITAKNTENDLLTGFNLGGDDFIKKPFSIKELVVRVKAVLSRYKKTGTRSGKIRKFDDIDLNLERRTLSIKGKEIELTRKEYEIMRLLLENSGRIYSREEVLTMVWKHDSIVSDRTIDVHVTRLRKKIGEYGKFLKNKTGYGYYFEFE
ncbi:MAG: response regulator transcription factor [bacterium]